jgi:hypothetical protein
MVWMLMLLLLAPVVASAQVQIPGTGMSVPTSLPTKADLLAQAKQMVQDLTSMKSSGKLGADQVKQVDALLPKANALTAQLEKPQIATNKLSQLAKDLSDMQSQVGALKALVK